MSRERKKPRAWTQGEGREKKEKKGSAEPYVSIYLFVPRERRVRAEKEGGGILSAKTLIFNSRMNRRRSNYFYHSKRKGKGKGAAGFLFLTLTEEGGN